MARTSNKAIWRITFFSNSGNSDYVLLRSKECLITGNGMGAVLDGGVTMFFNKSVHSVVLEDSIEAKTLINAFSASNNKGTAIDMNQVPENKWNNAVSLDDLKLKKTDSP